MTRRTFIISLLCLTAAPSTGCATMLTAVLTQDARATAAVADVEAAAIVSLATADYGRANEAARPAPRPWLRTLPAHPDQRLVRNALQRHMPEMDACRRFMSDPKVGQHAVVFLHIEPNGEPSHIMVTGPDTAPVAPCTELVVTGWRFPQAAEMTPIRFVVRWEAYEQEPRREPSRPLTVGALQSGDRFESQAARDSNRSVL